MGPSSPVRGKPLESNSKGSFTCGAFQLRRPCGSAARFSSYNIQAVVFDQVLWGFSQRQHSLPLGGLRSGPGHHNRALAVMTTIHPALSRRACERPSSCQAAYKRPAQAPACTRREIPETGSVHHESQSRTLALSSSLIRSIIREISLRRRNSLPAIRRTYRSSGTDASRS